MQVVVLKHLLTKNAALMGGTALVLGHGNPRFSEDIDLTDVDEPMSLKNGLNKASEELCGLLNATSKLTPPKPGRATWRLLCEIRVGFSAQLHVDTQRFRPLTHHPIVVVYHGVPPFVFPSIDLKEIMADKLIALAFRNYTSGRDIFDLWFHWLRDKSSSETDSAIMQMMEEKLSARKIGKKDLVKHLRAKMTHGISRRTADEWERYLPVPLKKQALYKNIFDTVSEKIKALNL